MNVSTKVFQVRLAAMRVLCGVCTQHPSKITVCQARGVPHLDLSNIKFIQTACQIRLYVLRHHDVQFGIA